MEAQHLKAVLEASGIATMIKNEHVFGALGQAGDLQHFTHAGPLDPTPSSAPAWRCSACGENLEAQFDVCWQCGARRPEPD